jgi:hypothetical protein
MHKALIALTLMFLPFSAVTQAHAQQSDQTVIAPLHPIGGSGVSGMVGLLQLQNGQGTAIRVFARGLMPGHHYRSLYYGNATCQIEPYSSSDVIGEYTANPFGMA